MHDKQLESGRAKRVEFIESLSQCVAEVSLESSADPKQQSRLRLATSILSLHNSIEHLLTRIEKIKR